MLKWIVSITYVQFPSYKLGDEMKLIKKSMFWSVQNGFTALALATQSGNTDIVRVLLEAKADTGIPENVRIVEYSCTSLLPHSTKVFLRKSTSAMIVVVCSMCSLKMCCTQTYKPLTQEWTTIICVYVYRFTMVKFIVLNITPYFIYTTILHSVIHFTT